MRNTQLVFSMFGSDLEPDAVSKLLGFVAARSHRRGDYFELSDGRPARRESGFCLFASTSSIDANAEFDLHAEWLLNVLEPHTAVLRTWAAQGWRLQIGVMIAVESKGGGILVSGDKMRRLGQLELPVHWYMAGSAPPGGLEQET